MIGLITISILSLIIAASSEAVMDTLAHHFEESVFKDLNPQWWDPKISGNNKWIYDGNTKRERFPLSSTLLVGITEAWHTFKMIRTFFILVGVITCTMVTFDLLEDKILALWVFCVTLLVSRFVFGVVFTLCYKIFKIQTIDMGRFERRGFNIFDRVTSVLLFIFGLISSITFWVFLSKGDVFDNWYPLVGMLVASHGSLIGVTFYEIMRHTGKTFKELFKKEEQ